ncbi:MAG: DNA-binding response OmpR family regulator [Alphaproteobacteria bacterium]|jgi:DNA-binding response OmpR family regulator/HPt (histidine-containing phosphotransfer) domain-containing protein
MDKDYDIVLKEIKVVFLQRLEEQRKQFKVFLLSCEKEKVDAESLKSISVLAHQLAGNGATFGFQNISTLAAKIEMVLQGHPLQYADLVRLLKGFIEEMALAIENRPSVVKESQNQEVLEPQKIKENKKVFDRDRRLLVVDDDILLQQMVSKILQGENIDVVFCGNGEDALKLVDQESFDLIILDMNMPGLNGIETLSALKENKALSHIPVVMLTRRDEDKNVVNCLKQGAIDYIIKPFDATLFVSRITNILKSQHQKILIADDDELICTLLQQKFEGLGYSILLAKHGEEALALAKEKKPAIIIMDIMMPARDGLSVLKELKKDDELKHIPVILLTAKNQRENVLIGLESGAHDYVTKPFDVDELAARVVGILQRQIVL